MRRSKEEYRLGRVKNASVAFPLFIGNDQGLTSYISTTLTHEYDEMNEITFLQTNPPRLWQMNTMGREVSYEQSVFSSLLLAGGSLKPPNAKKVRFLL